MYGGVGVENPRKIQVDMFLYILCAITAQGQSPSSPLSTRWIISIKSSPVPNLDMGLNPLVSDVSVE